MWGWPIREPGNEAICCLYHMHSASASGTVHNEGFDWTNNYTRNNRLVHGWVRVTGSSKVEQFCIYTATLHNASCGNGENNYQGVVR